MNIPPDDRSGAKPSLFSDLPETLTDEQAEELKSLLSRHYRDRVATASEHCRALMDWVETMQKSGYAPDVGKAWNSIYITLMKSNLAARLVYGGEKVRVEPCPKHKGRWSGCKWGGEACDEGCMYGSNVTGWLAEAHAFDPWPDDESAASQREHFKYDPTIRCRRCGGLEGAQVHA